MNRTFKFCLVNAVLILGFMTTTAWAQVSSPTALEEKVELSRGSWRKATKNDFPVVPKITDRRHIVSDELTRSLIEKVVNESEDPAGLLRKVGYDPANFGGDIQKAARKWQLDVFNKRDNLWVGSAEENQRLGRAIRKDKNINGPYRVDLPPGKQSLLPLPNEPVELITKRSQPAELVVKKGGKASKFLPLIGIVTGGGLLIYEYSTAQDDLSKVDAVLGNAPGFIPVVGDAFELGYGIGLELREVEVALGKGNKITIGRLSEKTGDAVFEIAEENGGGVTGYLKGVWKFYTRQK
jgi:hypothetical protein